MKNSQEDRLSMYLALKDFLIQNAGITKELPNFESNFGEFQNLITEIKSIAEKQKDDKSGLTKVKKELRDKLITLSLDNSLKLNAYAVDTNKTKLKSAVKTTRTKLSKAPDTALRDYAKLIYDKAQGNIDSLADYGINPATQTVFLEASNAYFTAIAGPRTGISERRQATLKLGELLDKADIVISRMDSSIGIIKLSQPDFVNGFNGSKKVVETGKGSLALKASVTEINTGTAIKGVLFSFKPEGSALEGTISNIEIVKKSAKKGIFIIKSMPSGTYTVYITKPGYKDKIVRVAIANGEMSELKVEMERAPR